MTVSPSSPKPARSRPKWVLASIGAVLVALVALVGAASALSGHGLHVRAFAGAAMNMVRAVRDHQAIASGTGDYKKIVLLHHSVGHNLIEQGSVRELFTAAGYQFWDHDYNYPGLTGPTGKAAGYHYNVPGDNTDPDGLLTIFTQPVFGLPLNTLSGLMQHEVIAFKSCFPASNIVSDAQLAERKAWYLKIRDFMDKHPEKLFVVVTQPPLNPIETNAEAAVRARTFANWLKSDEFLKGHPNVFTYDLFDALAESDPALPDANMLRESYRTGGDSHPNPQANEVVGPVFVDSVLKAIERYRGVGQS